MDKLARYKKAIAGAVGAPLIALAAAWFVTSPGVITGSEWFLIVSALVGGGAGPAVGPKNRERGAVSVLYILALVVLVLLILWLLGALR